MPGPLTVCCPSCGASLKLRSREYVGRKVACPKCRRPFVVEDPAADGDDDFSALDEFDSFEDARDADDDFEDEYERPAPRRPGRAATGGSRRPERPANRTAKGRTASRRNQNRLPLIIGASALGLALLAGLGFVVSGLLRGGGVDAAEVRELSYLPPDAELVVNVRLGDVLDSPWKDQLFQPEQERALAAVKAQSDIDFMQMETISVAVSGLKLGPEAVGPAAAMNFNPMLNSNLGFLLILRSRADFPLARIRRSSRSLSHKGETFYMDRGPIPAAIYLPNSRTMVVGLEPHVRSAIDRGPQPPELQQFAFADLKQHFSVAFVPKDRSFLQSFEVPEVPGTPAVKKLGDAVRTATGVSGELSYGSDAAVVQLRVRCGSSQDAAQMKAALDELLPQGRTMLEMFKGMADPEAAQGLEIAGQILGGLTVSQSGETVVARASLTRETAAQLQRLGSLQSAF